MEGNNSNYSMDDAYWGQERTQLEYYKFIMRAFVAGPLIIGGLIGNAIAFRTLGKLMRQNVTTFTLRALAVADICVLLCYVVYFCSWHAGHWPPVIAKLRPYALIYMSPVLYISTLVNVWTTVVIGLNRYIALCRPLHATRLCTPSRARKYMICIVLIAVAYVLPTFFDFKIRKAADGSTNIEVVLPNNRCYYYIYTIGCNAMFRYLIPFVMLLFFCVRIVTALRASRRQQLDRIGRQQVDTKITSMLLVLLGVFLVCHVSIWIWNFLHIFSSIPFIYMAFGVPVIDVLYILNSSVNCLIYLIYIKQFRRLLCGRCTRCLHQNQDYELT